MKILHTADWHLGKIVNAVHMTDDQAYVLDQLFEIIDSEQPDCVVISGDIYDRSIPPKDAVGLFDRTITKLSRDYNFPVLVTSGNHDSPDRLQFGRALFRDNQLYFETKLTAIIEQVTLQDDYGPVTFHLIPFFEPNEVRYHFQIDAMLTHHEAMEVVVQSIRDRVDLSERHVILAHAFIAGGMETDSEERLSMIGGSPYVDQSVFDGFDYVALGHLHQPQQVKRLNVQYSGSLLKYSFSEARHKKSVTVVNLAEKNNVTLERRLLKPKRDLRIVEGKFHDLLTKTEASDDYLLVRLDDTEEVIDPMSELRKKFPNILRLEYKRTHRDVALDELDQTPVTERMSDDALFEHFYQEMTGETMTDTERTLLAEGLAHIKKHERGR
ncbi:exonuclease SbcD [Halolactibacillus halophilus]|uniref:Nuclease SbcCD subunit D n=1 Tax=Halolactibacillus halophilus TaxID=306540 RepID=A0A1I5NU69_9BACI|nr:exonuclease SbcCD subunit D [Halolactibacillus halophilus]GEM01446.1 nuclease SbcCD subunit D [Halolactibacillus halophilus]SFP25312.1 exonuclease SbcD [Halolactibacillus halophilus]